MDICDTDSEEDYTLEELVQVFIFISGKTV
jgi:hypothetical protein